MGASSYNQRGQLCPGDTLRISHPSISLSSELFVDKFAFCSLLRKNSQVKFINVEVEQML
jgi:hypothetical protein